MYQRLLTARDARRDENGFTLIELLIVIVILGVLAAIVVFAVGGITDRGDSAACKADVKSVEVAQEAYYAKNKAYATTTQLVNEKLLRSAPTGTGSPAVNVVAAAANGDVTVDGTVVTGANLNTLCA